MKKSILIIASLLIAAYPAPGMATGHPLAASGVMIAASDPILSGGAPEEAKSEMGRTYIVKLRNGGNLQTDNYALEKGRVRVVLPTGAIYLDKAMIESIQEVSKGDSGTVQEIFRSDDTPVRVQHRTDDIDRPAPPTSRPGRDAKPYTQPSQSYRPMEETDNNGHGRDWWQSYIAEWQGKLKVAETKYDKASVGWNKYNGIIGNSPDKLRLAEAELAKEKGDLARYNAIIAEIKMQTGNTLDTNISDFQSQEYQDLRGASRIKMDEAQAEIDEAKRMLNEVIPDEARKAGAPPGWVRY